MLKACSRCGWSKPTPEHPWTQGNVLWGWPPNCWCYLVPPKLWVKSVSIAPSWIIAWQQKSKSDVSKKCCSIPEYQDSGLLPKLSLELLFYSIGLPSNETAIVQLVPSLCLNQFEEYDPSINIKKQAEEYNSYHLPNFTAGLCTPRRSANRSKWRSRSLERRLNGSSTFRGASLKCHQGPHESSGSRCKQWVWTG